MIEPHPLNSETAEPFPAWAREGHAHLLHADPPMAALARRMGPVTREPTRDFFGRLVRAIVGQQISGQATTAIYRRLKAAAGDPLVPEALDGLPDDVLRGCGLSTNKLLAVRDLTAHALDGRLDLAHLESQPDEEVRVRLVAVRGIGRWTADMFLMFALGRPDVFPHDDLGILEAMKRLYGLEARPTPKTALKMAEEGGWHPFASAASFMLWDSLK